MAPRKSGRNKIVAQVVTGPKKPCAFCQRVIDDEVTYGKLYTIGDIHCHYFCVLLSSCLIQKGRDEDGLFGFTYDDILLELERSKKHKCSYCLRGGASLGCSVQQCKKQFHLPCGRERKAVSLFHGNYKSFCEVHAPKQVIPDNIMCKAKLRMAGVRKAKRTAPNLNNLKELSSLSDNVSCDETESVCVICYERVDGYPTTQTFWPPCCARDAWFHRTCLQRMALSAGIHYLKCPLCNDKDRFYKAVVTQGYYVPDRDASWELEQNAFSGIYDRAVVCTASDCTCPMGRDHDDDSGDWCIKLCILCGSGGGHTKCMQDISPLVCNICRPAASEDLQQLATALEQVILEEERQNSTRTRSGPIMPSRMSLRRTKRHVAPINFPSCSSANYNVKIENESQENTSTTLSSRQELNLKTPIRRSSNATTPQKAIDLVHSPLKMLEDSLRNKMGNTDMLDQHVIDKLRRQFRKPKPLSKKKKIVNDILNGLFDNLLQEPKKKEAVKGWCSPKKSPHIKEEFFEDTPTTHTNKRFKKSPTQNASIEPKTEHNSDSSNSSFELPPEFIAESSNESVPIFNTPKKLTTIEIQNNSSLEISNNEETVHIDVFKMAASQNGDDFKKLINSPIENKKCFMKFSKFNNEILDSDKIDIDVESFKNHYLNEVLRKEKKIERKNKKSAKRLRGKRKREYKDKIVLKYESPRKKDKEKNVSISNKDIKVKIKWRKEQFKLKITDSNRKKSKKFKQYVLKYSSEEKTKIVKPEVDLTPKKIKRMGKKQEKTPDNLVQTSIQSFFKVKPVQD